MTQVTFYKKKLITKCFRQLKTENIILEVSINYDCFAKFYWILQSLETIQCRAYSNAHHSVLREKQILWRWDLKGPLACPTPASNHKQYHKSNIYFSSCRLSHKIILIIGLKMIVWTEIFSYGDLEKNKKSFQLWQNYLRKTGSVK